MESTNFLKKQNVIGTIYIVLKSCIIVASVLIFLFIVTVYLCALVRVIRIPFFPTSQTDTKWQSEDETIYFCINENSPDIGEVIIKGEKVEFRCKYNKGRGQYIWRFGKRRGGFIQGELDELTKGIARFCGAVQQ